MTEIYISRFENKLYYLREGKNGYISMRDIVNTVSGLVVGKWRRIGKEQFDQIKHDCILKVN